MTGMRTEATAASIIRHNISANAVYMLPFKGNRWKEGWQLSGITSWHTGVPFSLGEGDQMDTGNTFDNERPNYVGRLQCLCEPVPNAMVQRSLLCALAVWHGRQSGKERAASGPGMRRRIFP